MLPGSSACPSGRCLGCLLRSRSVLAIPRCCLGTSPQWCRNLLLRSFLPRPPQSPRRTERRSSLPPPTKKQLQHTEHDERTLLHSLRPPRVTEPSAQSTPIIPRSLVQPAEPAVVRPSAALSAPFIFITYGRPRSPERAVLHRPWCQ